MNKISSINLFTQGDSMKHSTWSNVPFCFAKAIEKQGIILHRVNIDPTLNVFFRFYQKIWYKYFSKLIFLFNEKSIYSINRSIIYRILVYWKIRNAIKKNPDVDYNIFLTFSYTNIFSSTPSLLICDYTLEIYIKEKLNRKPDFFESLYIRYENIVISRSEKVINLFYNYANKMTEKYKKNVMFIDRMGLNIPSNTNLKETYILGIKNKSNNILFIGNKWNGSYKNAADLLIKAFEVLRLERPQFKLHIVGMGSEMFHNVPDNVIFYDYLDKDDDYQRKVYYDLLTEAKIFINTSGSFGATSEAMYFFTPVVTTPYPEFASHFGEDISFGKYCKTKDEFALKQCIIDVLDSDCYMLMCKNAHDLVAPFTWDNYVEKMLLRV